MIREQNAIVAESQSHYGVVIQAASNSQWLYVVVNKRLFTSHSGVAATKEEAIMRAASCMKVAH